MTERISPWNQRQRNADSHGSALRAARDPSTENIQKTCHVSLHKQRTPCKFQVLQRKPCASSLHCHGEPGNSQRMQVSTSDVRVAFMHAVASEPKYENPPVEQRTAGWLWLIKKAMNGMRRASKDFGDLVAEVMNEYSSSEEKQTHRSAKTPNPKQQSYSTLTTQS